MTTMNTTPSSVRLRHRECLSLTSKPSGRAPPVSSPNLVQFFANIYFRYISYVFIYLSAFFSLPVTRHTGEELSHEEVVNKLDNDTVSYDIGLGADGRYMETARISIRVEKSRYEDAVAWLKDLLYGSKFDKERYVIHAVVVNQPRSRICRLQVTVAKTLQSLPELKRDGNTVLGSVCSDLLYDSSSTSRYSGVLPQAEFIPKLAEQLHEKPEEAIAAFVKIRQHGQYQAKVD